MLRKGLALALLWTQGGYAQSCSAIQNTIQAGSAYFQTENIDVHFGGTDATYYPQLAAPDKVSVTTTFAAESTPSPTASGVNLSPVYRLHSWMGGAVLWATGEAQGGNDGYYVANGNCTWPSPVFQQHTVIGDPVMLTYSSPPGTTSGSHTARGIALSLPYPYLIPDAAYGSCCTAADSSWNVPPLTVETDPIPTLLIYPSYSLPVDGVTSDDQIWGPTALLVDKMGDYSVDLIYQDPNHPYVRTPMSETAGQGNYIKFTIVQGSPFVFCETCASNIGANSYYIVISNRITTSNPAINPGTIVAATNGANVSGVTNIQYSLFGGDQIDPGQFAEGASLNPLAATPLQDNYTTWAVYFNSTTCTYTPGSGTTLPQNSFFTVTNPGTKFYFVMTALPTIYEYPHQMGSTYASATTAANYNINTYAAALGQYAFNYVTNTAVTYAVSRQTFVNTTYTPTLAQPYGSSAVVDITKTIMCLMPHHYQNLTFDQTTSLSPTVLPTSDSWASFSPANTSSLFYWTVRGNLQTILGSGFTTQYIFSNFLPDMPPPNWTDTVSLGGANGIATYATNVQIGQLLFDSLGNNYLNWTNPNFQPWNTGYFSQTKGVYDVGKALQQSAKQLGLMLHYIQGFEQNTGSGTFETFFNVPANQPPLSGCCSYATSSYTTLYEQQYNNTWSSNPDRPGGFNPNSGINLQPPPVIGLQALQNALSSSVIGNTTIQPPAIGVEGAISPYFFQTPKSSTACPAFLSHYAYYDPIAHMVMLYPSAGVPPAPSSAVVPWPGRVATPPNHASCGFVWESFGVANAFNDHHYQYGYWISAAALAAIFENGWLSTPTASSWALSSEWGAAIDQLVKDIAYDPSIDNSFYSDNCGFMKFAKMNFFDQWAGHGWADGIQATIAGGNSGHNENSIGEALQAYASIILWGMATGRKPIVDLGIYLYTTSAYAMHMYFFDQNLNLVPSNGFFMPVTTASSATYPNGTGFWDYTIHSTSPSSSGTPKIAQNVIYYSADFGQTPQNVKLITAFPCNSFSLVFGRNKAYLNAWNASMDTCPFNQLIGTATSSCSCWDIAFTANFNMLRALGGNSTGCGIFQSTCPPQTTTLTPYETMLALFTSGTSNGCPPWGSTGAGYADVSQSINEVIHFLHAIDHYGTPNWNLFGAGSSDPNALVFTATFTKGATTYYFAFNPTTNTIPVQFYKITAPGTPLLMSPLQVSPKRWAWTSGATP